MRPVHPWGRSGRNPDSTNVAASLVGAWLERFDQLVQTTTRNASRRRARRLLSLWGRLARARPDLLRGRADSLRSPAALGPHGLHLAEQVKQDFVATLWLARSRRLQRSYDRLLDPTRRRRWARRLLVGLDTVELAWLVSERLGQPGPRPLTLRLCQQWLVHHGSDWIEAERFVIDLCTTIRPDLYQVDPGLAQTAQKYRIILDALAEMVALDPACVRAFPSEVGERLHDRIASTPSGSHPLAPAGETRLVERRHRRVASIGEPLPHGLVRRIPIMSRLLITTVGTSLLTNRDGRPWAGWTRQTPLPELSLVASWLEKSDPGAASAETNTLRSLPLLQTDRVLLLHSDTDEGRFCSAGLAAWLSSRCLGVEQRQLGSLGYNAESTAQRGLRSFVSEVMRAITRARQGGLEPVLCATGGFKAEIAFANLLGALLRVEVYYIHEQFRELIRLPALPLEWDAGCVERHRDFFEWIDAEPRRSVEAESWLKGRAELRPLVEEAEDGHTYLNAAGELLFQAARQRLQDGPRACWPDADPRPPQEKNQVSTEEHHRPRGWERVVTRLGIIDCVSSIRYDEAAYGGPAVKVLDATRGAIGVRYTSGERTLPLRVETTARGEEQTELVAAYVRRILK